MENNRENREKKLETIVGAVAPENGEVTLDYARLEKQHSNLRRYALYTCLGVVAAATTAAALIAYANRALIWGRGFEVGHF